MKRHYQQRTEQIDLPTDNTLNESPLDDYNVIETTNASSIKGDEMENKSRLKRTLAWL